MKTWKRCFTNYGSWNPNLENESPTLERVEGSVDQVRHPLQVWRVWPATNQCHQGGCIVYETNASTMSKFIRSAIRSSSGAIFLSSGEHRSHMHDGWDVCHTCFPLLACWSSHTITKPPVPCLGVSKAASDSTQNRWGAGQHRKDTRGSRSEDCLNNFEQ